MRRRDVRTTTRRLMPPPLGIAAIAAAALTIPILSPAQAPPAGKPGNMTLLGTLSEWKYPGSDLLGEAVMKDGGDPSVQDVQCLATLTTPDPIDKVIAYYAARFEADPAGAGAATEARAVCTQDDSRGRPVALRVFVVNRADSTTTLVLSRANGEAETHVAWTHYRRLGPGGR